MGIQWDHHEDSVEDFRISHDHAFGEPAIVTLNLVWQQMSVVQHSIVLISKTEGAYKTAQKREVQAGQVTSPTLLRRAGRL
jgi:hypothetical protein